MMTDLQKKERELHADDVGCSQYAITAKSNERLNYKFNILFI